MSVEISKLPDIAMIKLHGHLDAVTAPRQEPEILTLINSSTIPLVVDLSEVNYVSSEGLRLFMVMAKTARQNNLPIIFASPTAMVREVLEVTMFIKILTVAPSVTQAVKDLRSQ